MFLHIVLLNNQKTFNDQKKQEKNDTENISEELRVLYVALTRAKQKLILIASVKGTEKLAEKCDLSHSLISNIESQKVQQSFSIAVLYRIFRILEIDIKEFFVDRNL